MPASANVKNSGGDLRCSAVFGCVCFGHPPEHVRRQTFSRKMFRASTRSGTLYVVRVPCRDVPLHGALGRDVPPVVDCFRLAVVVAFGGGDDRGRHPREALAAG